MPPLVELPNELLGDVLFRLSQVDLARVCCVSRHLLSIAEPFLYQDVALCTLHTSIPQIQIFLRTILLRPILASCVQSLAIQWHNVTTEITTSSSDRDPINANEIALLSAAESPHDLELGFQKQEKYIKLLFHHLPRLEILELFPPHGLDIFDGQQLERNSMFSPSCAESIVTGFSIGMPRLTPHSLPCLCSRAFTPSTCVSWAALIVRE